MLKLSALIAQYLAFVKERQAPRTFDYYRVWLSRFLTHVGDLDANDIRRHHLLTYAKSWYEFQTVQRLFRWAAVEMELLERNPFTNIKRPPLGNRRRILSKREVARMLRGADAQFRPFLLAMRETSARPQEISQVRWTDLRDCDGNADPARAIAQSGGWFELSEFKARTRRRDTAAVRVLFLTDRLRRSLARLWERAEDRRGEVYRNARDVAWNRNSLRCRVRRLRDRVGLVADGNGEKLCLYTLRHSVATRLATSLTEYALMGVLGHTSTRTTQRYVHWQRLSLGEQFRQAMKRKS